jgi:HEAT repeat protein
MAGMQDPDPYVRSLIVGTLGLVLPQWPGAEELLMEALSDPEPEVRRRALSVLWDKAQPRSNEVLTIALQDTDPAIRGQAHELLQEVALPVVFDQ